MQNSYYFIKHLAPALEQRLEGFQIAECFSQNKDELIIGFATDNKSFYIKASLEATFCCLFFPENFNRSKKNSVGLFNEVIGRQVLRVIHYSNERCFSVQLSDGYLLLFKMHGNRSNIILYRDEVFVAMFRNNLHQDQDIALSALHRDILQTREAFEHNQGDYKPLFPTFGRVVKQYLNQMGYEVLSLEKRWEALQALLNTLEKPHFYTVELEGTLQFALFPIGDVLATHDSPIEAINHFFITYVKEGHLKQAKKALLNGLNKSLKQTQGYLKKTGNKLNEINNRMSHEMIANILMANLYNISTGATEVTLDNFYDNSQVTIKLKANLSPQKNAELFYKKAKNQKIEIQNLEESLAVKKKSQEKLAAQIAYINECQDVKSLKAWAKEQGLNQQNQGQTIRVPYHKFNYGGYEIWVGKNAQANDELTLKHAWKEDLWLHAKDTSGSHVVVKHQPGKNFPKDVIEKAAQLAAYFSKAKNDTLCPVIYTPKKFVRKRKGSLPGMVIVEKEAVALVPPEKWV